MATQEEVDAYLAQVGEKPFKEFPGLTAICAVLEVGYGRPLAGSYSLEYRFDMSERESLPYLEPIKAKNSFPMTRRTVAGSAVVAACLDEETRPCPGGHGITSLGAALGAQVGTLAGRVSLDGKEGFFLSSWHVLAAGGAEAGSVIIQPSLRDGGYKEEHRLGALIESGKLLTEMVDVAVGKADNPYDLAAGTRHFSIKGGADTFSPSVGMKVKIDGRGYPQVRKGKISSTNCSVRVTGPYPGGEKIFQKQLCADVKLKSGDSGALLVQRKTNYVVGMVMAREAGSDCSYHNNIVHIREAVKAEYGELKFY